MLYLVRCKCDCATIAIWFYYEPQNCTSVYRLPQEQRVVQSGLPQQHIFNAPRINEDGCAKFADPESRITPERVKIAKQLI